MSSKRQSKMRKNSKWSNRLALLGITLVVICLAFTVNLKRSSMEKKDLEYQVKQENLISKVEEESKRADELEQQRIYVQTKQYIEKVAKEKLGMVNPDEILLKPAE